MKVYLDEHLSPVIAEILRRHGIDALAAQEAGTVQLNDRAQLAHATGEGRALVTGNVAHFVQLAREAVATNTPHAGIVLLPSSFRGDEFQAIADAIRAAVTPYPHGLPGLVIYARR